MNDPYCPACGGTRTAEDTRPRLDRLAGAAPAGQVAREEVEA